MPRFLRHWVPLCLTPLLASCVFLLDYDDLQSSGAVETGGAGGVPTTSAAGASTTNGGEGGADSSP
jgi:hypothetical protein